MHTKKKKKKKKNNVDITTAAEPELWHCTCSVPSLNLASIGKERNNQVASLKCVCQNTPGISS